MKNSNVLCSIMVHDRVDWISMDKFSYNSELGSKIMIQALYNAVKKGKG